MEDLGRYVGVGIAFASEKSVVENERGGATGMFIDRRLTLAVANSKESENVSTLRGRHDMRISGYSSGIRWKQYVHTSQLYVDIVSICPDTL